jgi:hypothetical protein
MFALVGATAIADASGIDVFVPIAVAVWAALAAYAWGHGRLALFVAIVPVYYGLAFGVADQLDAPCSLRQTSPAIRERRRYVVAVATTLPDQVLGLTSCYLSAFGGEIAASHLRLGPDRYQRLSAQALLPAPHATQHARACLLDHAAELQQTIVELTDDSKSSSTSPPARSNAPARPGDPPHPTPESDSSSSPAARARR